MTREFCFLSSQEPNLYPANKDMPLNSETICFMQTVEIPTVLQKSIKILKTTEYNQFLIIIIYFYVSLIIHESFYNSFHII